MAKPTLNIWGENASIPPLTPSQQAQGYAYTASKPGQLAGTVNTEDLDYPMQQVTAAVAFVLERMSDNGHINGMEWISGQSYVTGNIVVGSDGNQYYCNTDNSSQNPVGDGTDKWRQYPFIETSSTREWYNGRLECWGSFQITAVKTALPGGGALYDGSSAVLLPFNYASVDNVNSQRIATGVVAVETSSGYVVGNVLNLTVGAISALSSTAPTLSLTGHWYVSGK